jgi:hypothetical protein
VVIEDASPKTVLTRSVCIVPHIRSRATLRPLLNARGEVMRDAVLSVSGQLNRQLVAQLITMLPVRWCDAYHPHAGLAKEAIATGHLKYTGLAQTFATGIALVAECANGFDVLTVSMKLLGVLVVRRARKTSTHGIDKHHVCKIKPRLIVINQLVRRWHCCTVFIHQNSAWT